MQLLSGSFRSNSFDSFCGFQYNDVELVDPRMIDIAQLSLF